MDELELITNCTKIIRQNKFDYALVGGVAVGIRTIERYTKDIDFTIAVSSDKKAESLVRIFTSNGYEIEKVLEHKATGFLSLVIFSKITDNKYINRVDLIFNQTGIEKEVVKEAERIKFQGGELKVATISHLIAMKTLSLDDKNRPQDRIDLKNLISVATENDIRKANEAVKLITKRGFNQKKDLETKLKLLVQVYKAKDQRQKIRR